MQFGAHAWAPAALHFPPLHVPAAQSDVCPQSAPAAHVPWHAGFAHLPAVQTSEAQSEFAPHAAPLRQLGAHAADAQRPSLQEPDSQSVFPEHSAPSVHVGVHAAQVVPVHTSVKQSVLPAQVTPTPQLGEQETHLPPAQVVLPLHGVAPEQHASPAPPHARQVPDWQMAPLPQLGVSAQQG